MECCAAWRCVFPLHATRLASKGGLLVPVAALRLTATGLLGHGSVLAEEKQRQLHSGSALALPIGTILRPGSDFASLVVPLWHCSPGHFDS